MVLDQIPENDYRVTGPVAPLSGTPCSMLRREMTVIFRLLMMTGSAVVAASAAERPNVLFIAIDDLNDTVGFLRNHPGARTPHMDRLAARAVSFTNAHCASPGCNASRTALLTGLRPSTTGIYANQDNWLENPRTRDAVTLPDSFRKAGYVTKGGGKIYHAHSFNAEAFRGFLDPEPWAEYFPSKERQMPVELRPDDWPVHSAKEFYGGHFDWAPMDIADEEMADGQVVAWAEKQLATEHDRPLFLAVGIYRPHVPWWTPRRYFDLHPLGEVRLPETREDDLEDVPKAGREFARRDWQEWITSNRQWKKAVQGYLASVTFADVMVGRLIAALENGPLAHNTIIVLWSDHGYHLGHKEHWEKFALWEQSTHVPLVFVDTRTQRDQSEPGWAAGSRCGQPASLLDIYPTLVELCHLDPVEALEGTSLVPLLANPGKKTGRAVVTTHKYGNHAVRSDRWRYIRYADGSEELYDHSSDPNEFTNLAQQEEHGEIKDDLARWLPATNRKPESADQ